MKYEDKFEEKQSGKKLKINFPVLIICLIVVFSMGFMGSLFNSDNTGGDWYESTRPDITPPGWVFPVVWNILFLMIAIGLYLVWEKSESKNIKKKIIFIFGINFIINVSWSFFYFSLKSPFMAFFVIILLWLSIISMIMVSYKIDKKAFYLLIPYFVWVSFAGVLNYLSI